MKEFKLSEEVIAVLRNCKNADEIISLAKSKNFELPKDKAEKIFGWVNSDKLFDEDLNKVIGGEGGNDLNKWPWETFY